MAFVDQLVMNLLDHDPDECERVLRTTVGERLAANPPPKMDDQINPGVGARSNGAIFREVIDVLARLDGIDVRQTAPVRRGSLHIRPYGEEWGRLRRSPHEAPAGNQPDDERPCRGARPGRPDPQPD